MKDLYVSRGEINPRKTINNKHLCLPKFILQCTMRTYLIMKESTHNGYVFPSLTPCIRPPASHNWLSYYKMQITIADKTPTHPLKIWPYIHWRMHANYEYACSLIDKQPGPWQNSKMWIPEVRVFPIFSGLLVFKIRMLPFCERSSRQIFQHYI